MELSNVAPIAGADASAAAGAVGEKERTRRRPEAHPAMPPVLLTDLQVADLWGISVSFFYELRKAQHPWFPQAVQLAPKVVRYLRAEAEAAALAMPRQLITSEPERLRRGRIERMKAKGFAS